MKKKILIFTDSRGQHKPRGTNHKVFAERLAQDDRFDVDMFLCPMKWTTTLDFLNSFSEDELASYDHVILYTGIVDWSPRQAGSAENDLYNNQNTSNLGNLALNTRDYAQKSVNNKKEIFDSVFGADAMAAHFADPSDIEYEGHKTNNMYGLDMARAHLLPRLKKIDNLIFITSNPFVKGWNGDYPRERPENINISHAYSKLFAEHLPAERLVHLGAWTDEEVKRFTCDNLHLSKRGNDYIYIELCRILDVVPDHRNSHRSDTILMIGNGPSAQQLVDIGFENIPDNIDTFGMGAAYRHFERIGWWPRYYAWCDKKVVLSHHKTFENLVGNQQVSTEKFFFSLPVSDQPRLEVVDHSSTGDFCVRKAIELGYKNIIMIGIEAQYVEKIAESRDLSEDEYHALGYDKLFDQFRHIHKDPKQAFSLYRDNLRIIIRTPDTNPNYFFDDYQQKGDVFSLPRSQTHKNAWAKTISFAEKNDVNLFNVSDLSTLEGITSAELKDIFAGNVVTPQVRKVARNFKPIVFPRKVSDRQAASIRKKLNKNAGEPIATMFIGARLDGEYDYRHENLEFLLTWLVGKYGDLFDIVIIEQAAEQVAPQMLKNWTDKVRFEFLYNPEPYNRGWGYNVAASHFSTAEVLGFLDTDVLPNANFLDEVIACYEAYDFVSPYSQVYFTSETERTALLENKPHLHLDRNEALSKPVTVAGGILLAKKTAFEKLWGYEQYVEYGGEDRALDVVMEQCWDQSKIHVSDECYAHLWHPTGESARPRATELFAHLRKTYGCRVAPGAKKPGGDPHEACNHTPKRKLEHAMAIKQLNYGDPDLYRHGKPLSVNGHIGVEDLALFDPIERITKAKRPAIMKKAERPQDATLATLVIGVRLTDNVPGRADNLRVLLSWIDHYYGDLFDVLLVEQDSEQRVDLKALEAAPYVRHEFLYNPSDFNRGWGFNTAVLKFCADAQVVVMMDTDVLPGSKFLRCVIDCCGQYDAISPYQNIYYADAGEVATLASTKTLTKLNGKTIKQKPVTFSGGILIMDRRKFVSLKGFEQYTGYGFEDRAMDVNITNHLSASRVRVEFETCVHLHHASQTDDWVQTRKIGAHTKTHYGCVYDPDLAGSDDIHKSCSHVGRKATLPLMIERAETFGDPDLYRSKAALTINGTYKRRQKSPKVDEVIFPPAFKALETYEAKEIYADAPEPDSKKLTSFYNAFKGQRCFIIGNGPSLNKHDLSLLENEYTFGVNSFYYKTRETGFMPYFYVVEDSSVMTENLEEIRNFDAPFKFFPTNYKSLHPEQPNTFFFRMNRSFYEKSSPNFVVPRFSTDASKELFCGQSVTYINLQLAFFMGFTQVYLIGMDFDYTIPDSHKRTGDMILSDTDDDNHFHKDYFGAGKTWKDPKLERVLMNYKMADLAFSSVGRKVYNATCGGKLEVFDRVDYDVLLGNNKRQAASGEHFSKPSGSAPDDTGCALYVASGNAGLLHRAVTDDLTLTGEKGVLLYTDPRRLLVRAMSDKQDINVVLERWSRQATEHLALLRRNRKALVVAEHGNAADNREGFLTALKGHGISETRLSLPQWPAPDPLLLTLANICLGSNTRATRLLAELDASSVLARDKSQAVPVEVSVETSVQRYHEMTHLVKELEKLQGQLQQENAAIQTQAEQTTRLQGEQLIQLQATLEDYVAAAEKERMALEEERTVSKGARQKLTDQEHEARQKLTDLEHQIRDLSDRLDEVYRSNSWRVTGPLRVVSRLIKHRD